MMLGLGYRRSRGAARVVGSRSEFAVDLWLLVALLTAESNQRWDMKLTRIVILAGSMFSLLILTAKWFCRS